MHRGRIYLWCRDFPRSQPFTIVMPLLRRSAFLSFCAALLLQGVSAATASPVINEIMFHPVPHPVPVGEDVSEEWIELYNDSASSLNLSGWTLSKGVTF